MKHVLQVGKRLAKKYRHTYRHIAAIVLSFLHLFVIFTFKCFSMISQQIYFYFLSLSYSFRLQRIQKQYCICLDYIFFFIFLTVVQGDINTDNHIFGKFELFIKIRKLLT